MKIHKNILVAVLTLVCMAFGIVLPGHAFAEETGADYRLSITPTQKGFEELKPGKVYSETFKVRNTGHEPFDFMIEVTPYNVKGENYTVDYDSVSVYNEMVNWVTFDKTEGIVQPGEDAEVTYTINVPSDAHGGAQMVTIMVTMGIEENDSSNLQAVRRLGYVLYGNVDGEITKTGKVLENKIPSFLFNPPIFGTSVVENTGNIYTVAKYTLQVFPLFSDEEVYTNEEEPENSVVFPETKRYNEIKWDGAPHLGIFRVRQTVKIFDDESVTEKIVFLCPLWFLFVVLLLVFLIIFWIVSRILKRKREA